jgi:aspartate racemase
MSWESSLEYYRLINEAVRERLGGLHSAECLMFSVDFSPLEEMQQSGRWEEAGVAMAEAAQRLERGGADFIVLCTNTMHKLTPQIEAATRLPFLHIADAAAERIQAAGLRRVGLLGTRFTMEEDFYTGRLARYGLETLIPPADSRREVNRVIYEELCLGITRVESRVAYREVIAGLVERGAEGIILGCTEIGLLVKADDSPVQLFDTTRIHAEAAVKMALQ